MKPSFVYPGSVWWRCFAVWWRHRLPDTTPSTKTNDNISQRSSPIWPFFNKECLLRQKPPKASGGDTSFKKLSKCDDQLSSKDTSTSSWTTSTSQRLENVFYSTMTRQLTSSYSRSESPSIAAATTSRSDIHDVTDWYAYCIYRHWHWQNRFTSSRAEIEEKPTCSWKQLQKHYGACYVYLITW